MPNRKFVLRGYMQKQFKNTVSPVIRMSSFAIIASLCVVTSPSVSGAEQVHLSKMAGKWTGQGWALRKQGAPKESVRCRLTAKYSKKARKLSISGKCAASSGTFTLLGHIAEYSNSNKLTGRWVNPKGVGTANVAGSRKGNRLTFLLDRSSKKAKKAYKTVWDIRRNGFTLNTGHATGAHNALGQISFQR